MSSAALADYEARYSADAMAARWVRAYEMVLFNLRLAPSGTVRLAFQLEVPIARLRSRAVSRVG